MILYKIKLKPESAFGSPPISDTIFGNLIWSFVHIGIDVDKLLSNYMEEPFLVVSDFFLDDLGVTPKIPSVYTVGKNKKEKLDILMNRKEVKNRAYIPIDFLIKEKKLSKKIVLEKSESISKNIYMKSHVVRCSINRITGTTGEGFTPYSLVENFYKNNFFTFYFKCEESFCEKVIDALSYMGQVGFGKDATVGKGKFSVLKDSFEKIDLGDSSFNDIYTLSNLYMYNIPAKEAFYEPFTRFGKHGDILAITGNPFKNPVVTARQGAILLGIPADILKKGYIGSGIKGLSYHENTVYQGYSLFIPHKYEVEQ
ncbi:MAG: hypothetical protein LDL13_08975 [Calditerrivibrio sp.]|nr:hypothetical protein [Calditerrivibrio sp.]MCA1980817.1 hypothetical protein [Calditerrivibrio sp.]